MQPWWCGLLRAGNGSVLPGPFCAAGVRVRGGKDGKVADVRQLEQSDRGVGVLRHLASHNQVGYSSVEVNGDDSGRFRCILTQLILGEELRLSRAVSRSPSTHHVSAIKTAQQHLLNVFNSFQSISYTQTCKCGIRHVGCWGQQQ
jgi:hypothetical protein